MARSLRLQVPGGIYHVFNRGNDRQNIFRDEWDKQVFLSMLIDEIERCGWLLHDYALLDNHFHLLVETPEVSLSSGMHRLQTRYVGYFNRKYKRWGHLFGGRFKSILAERESYLKELSRYIVLNPVRAGIVERPENYRWSSYRAKAGFEEPPPWLCMSGLLDFGRDPKEAQIAFRRFVEAGIGVEDAVMDQVQGQNYLGGPEFLQWVQAWIDSEERSKEHPRFQRDVARPPISDILAAVCERLEITPEEVRSQRGHISRMVFAMLGYWEGLRTLRVIARELGLRSAAHVSNLVSRCRNECGTDEILRGIVEDCRRIALAHAPPLPEHYRARLPV